VGWGANGLSVARVLGAGCGDLGDDGVGRGRWRIGADAAHARCDPVDVAT